MRFEASAFLRAILAGGIAILFLSPAVLGDDAPPTPREDILATYLWPEALKDSLASPPLAGHAALVDAPADTPGGFTGKVLQIRANKSEPLRLRLLAVPNPPVTADFYALAGQVRYEGVEGVGYLEMWNMFPPNTPGGPERSFFSRTLGETADDPMESFRGTSAWRSVMLPFNSAGAGSRPTGLTVNLVLPAGGTVYLTPLHLSQYHYEQGRTGLVSPAAGAPGWPGWKFLTTVAALCLALVPGWMIWRAAHRRRAAEWRRMAAQDTSAG